MTVASGTQHCQSTTVILSSENKTKKKQRYKSLLTLSELDQTITRMAPTTITNTNHQLKCSTTTIYIEQIEEDYKLPERV